MHWPGEVSEGRDETVEHLLLLCDCYECVWRGVLGRLTATVLLIISQKAAAIGAVVHGVSRDLVDGVGGVVAVAAEPMALRAGLMLAQARKWLSLESETDAAVVYDDSLYEIQVLGSTWVLKTKRDRPEK